jgi:hypothetical protein
VFRGRVLRLLLALGIHAKQILRRLPDELEISHCQKIDDPVPFASWLLGGENHPQKSLQYLALDTEVLIRLFELLLLLGEIIGGAGAQYRWV